MSDFGQYLSNPLSQRQSIQSDVRPGSVNQRVLRAEDSLFTYDDDTITPVGDRVMAAGPVGAIVGFGSAAVPAGYLECDGSAVSRTTYARLFGVIGTTHGAGDGTTTFGLPDLSGGTVIYGVKV